MFNLDSSSPFALEAFLVFMVVSIVACDLPQLVEEDLVLLKKRLLQLAPVAAVDLDLVLLLHQVQVVVDHLAIGTANARGIVQ